MGRFCYELRTIEPRSLERLVTVIGVLVGEAKMNPFPPGVQIVGCFSLQVHHSSLGKPVFQLLLKCPSEGDPIPE